MSIDRRRFLTAAGLAGLALATPSLAATRDGRRVSSALSISFAAFPGVGRLGGPKLADAIWSNTKARGRVPDSIGVQLLAARLFAGKPVEGFASRVAKFASSDDGSVLAKLLRDEADYPNHFFQSDHYLPGDMYLPGSLSIPAPAMPAQRKQGYSAREALALLGKAEVRDVDPRHRGPQVRLAIACPDEAFALQGLVFELQPA